MKVLVSGFIALALLAYIPESLAERAKREVNGRLKHSIENYLDEFQRYINQIWHDQKEAIDNFDSNSDKAARPRRSVETDLELTDLIRSRRSTGERAKREINGRLKHSIENYMDEFQRYINQIWHDQKEAIDNFDSNSDKAARPRRSIENGPIRSRRGLKELKQAFKEFFDTIANEVLPLLKNAIKKLMKAFMPGGENKTEHSEEFSSNDGPPPVMEEQNENNQEE